MADYILKGDSEIIQGLTFDNEDTLKATSVNISDNYLYTVFSGVAYSKVSTIDASDRTKSIALAANSNKSVLKGGSNRDSIKGGSANDTLTGGAGADTFVGSAGKDVITDYDYSQGDVIRTAVGVTPTKVTTSTKNNDVVVTFSDKSTITLKEAHSKSLKFVDSDGELITKLSLAFGDTLLSADSDTSTFDLSLNTVAKDINGTASTVPAGLSIVANKLNNSIKGSDYTNNTIESGAGNDTLTGGTGTGIVNTYIFAENQGKNVITNFNTGSNDTADRILIKTGKITGHTIKGDDVILSIALNAKKTTTVTVVGARNKFIKVLKPNGDIDTGNSIIYRDPTDFIVTNQTKVNSDVTGTASKLIDASTEEYVLSQGTYITGNSNANTIIGSIYNDTLAGGTGKDTLTGGDGVDIFFYTAGEGNEVVTDFSTSSDISKADLLKLGADTTISQSVLDTKKGANDIVFTATTSEGKSKGTITLKNTGGGLIRILNTESYQIGTYDETVVSPQVYGVSNLTVGDDIIPATLFHYYDDGFGGGPSPVVDYRVVDTSYNSKVVTVDGSTVEEGKLFIIGNSGKNSLVGSQYGPNTLNGGKGNDTLLGAKGYSDAFLFDTVDGSDVILDFESGTDVVKLASNDVHITASSLVTKKGANDVLLTIGKTKVTLKGTVDTLPSYNAKGKLVTEYTPQKLTIENADGTQYRMTYGGTLAKVEDADMTITGGTLDFRYNTNIATIDAGGVILDGFTTEIVDGSEVLVAASSVSKRTQNVGIIGSAKANTIISASNDEANGSSAGAVITTVTGGKGNDVFILTSGGDMVITDYNANAKNEDDRIQLLDNQALIDAVKIDGSDVDDSGGDLLLTVSTKTTSVTNNGKSTVESSYNNVITVIGGAEKAISVVDTSGNISKQKYGAATIVIDNTSSQNIIAGSAVQVVENDGRTKPINITSTGTEEISIEAGSGNDTLNGGPSATETAKATLTGGGGKDVFYHTNGKFSELITDYEVGKDQLRFIEGMDIASISARNDTDIVLHFSTVTKVDGLTNLNGEGHITLQGGYGQKITVVKEKEEEVTTTSKSGVTTTKKTIKLSTNSQIYGSSELIILDADGSEVDASDGANNGYVSLVDASARTAKKPIQITGNSTTNSGTVNGLRYINSNTLIGGKGNDTLVTGDGGTTELTGGTGADVFYYRGGHVTIEDYTWNKKDASCDKILITDSTFSSIQNIFDPDNYTHYNGDDVVFTFDSNNSLTIKDAKGEHIAIINGDGATISSEELYNNPHEWLIDNKTAANSLKAIYIDSGSTSYTAISASTRSKAATIVGSKTDTEYLVTGGKGADYLIGNGAANTISAGKGNDTIKANGGGNNKALTDSTVKYNVLTGGDGKDVFYFNPEAADDEYDVITDYQVGKDTIKLAEGFHISNAAVTNSRATLTGQTGQATLNGVQASVTADGSVEVVKVKNKTVAKTTTTTPNDVVLTISDSDGAVRGTITVWDAAGYGSLLSSSSEVSVAAISPYKFTIAEEYTNSKKKLAVNTFAVDLVSSDITVVNADGTTVDASANESMVNMTASQTKPVRTSALYAIGNSKANSITGSAKNDTLRGNGAGKSADTLVGNAGNDYFMLDGKGDVIIQDYSSDKSNYDRIQLAEGVELTDGSASSDDLIMSYTFGGTTHYATLLGAASKKITVAGSDGKAGAQVYGGTVIEVANGDGDKVDVTSNRKVQTIDASKRSKNVMLIGNTVTNSVIGGSKNDTIDLTALSITGGVTGATINSGAGNDSIYGSSGADEVTLGAGVDTFYTGGGNDTVETGAGKDVVVYQGNHVVVTDYTAGQDIIQLSGDYAIYTEEENATHYVDTDGTTIVLNIAEHSVISGRDTVIISPTNSIRLLNAVNKKLSLIDSGGNASTITLSDPTIEVITNSSGSNITAGEKIKTVDASSRSNPVAITGGANTTSIKGGKAADTITLAATSGGTIQAAKGDDILNGVAGKTFYAYTSGDGKDTINNYADGDIIVLQSRATTVNDAKSSISGSDYVLTIGTGSITIKNGATKEIKVKKYGEDTPTTYNPQTSTEGTSSMKAYSELFETDNIYNDDNSLNDIINENAQLSNDDILTKNYELTPSLTEGQIIAQNLKENKFTK